MSRQSFGFTTNRIASGHDVPWEQRGICGDDPELHYPLGWTGAASLLQIEQAKARCRRCPVTDECLDWAIETGDVHGVLGATTPDERRAMKRGDMVAAA